MRFKHEHVEKPRVDYTAMPTPTYDDFRTVTLDVSIHGTKTSISTDLPPEKAREWAAEIIEACRIVESER